MGTKTSGTSTSGTKKAGTKQTTPPKGRATPKRDPRPSARGRYRSTIQWGLVALGVLALIVLAVVIGADWNDRVTHDPNAVASVVGIRYAPAALLVG